MEVDSGDSDSDSHNQRNNERTKQGKLKSILELTNVIDRRNIVKDLVIKYKVAQIRNEASINNTYEYIAEKYKQIIVEMMQGKNIKYTVKFKFDNFETKSDRFIDIVQLY
jgi:hypothetical protein